MQQNVHQQKTAQKNDLFAKMDFAMVRNLPMAYCGKYCSHFSCATNRSIFQSNYLLHTTQNIDVTPDATYPKATDASTTKGSISY